MKSKIVPVMKMPASSAKQFSDLEQGDYFLAFGNKSRHQLLYRVRKTNPRNINDWANNKEAFGYAECVGDSGGDYSTCSNQCFPNGVHLVNVDVVVTGYTEE